MPGVITNGNVYVDTWIGDDSNSVPQTTVGATDVYQVIKVDSGIQTYARTISVEGQLPSYRKCLEFVSANNDYWEKEFRQLIGSDQEKCLLNPFAVGNERVQCNDVKYKEL